MTRPDVFEPPIQALYKDGHLLAAVGVSKVTEITLTSVPGQMAKVPWFEVWVGDLLYESINAAHVSSVRYQMPEGWADEDEEEDLPF